MKKYKISDLQKILQDFYYQTRSVLKHVELTLPVLMDELEKNKNIFINHKDTDQSEILDKIFQKHAPKNPLSNEEVTKTNTLLIEELEKTGFTVISNKENNISVKFDIEKHIDNARDIMVLRKSVFDNAIVSLITYYENFLAEIARFHLTSNKSSINQNFSIEVKDILTYENYTQLIESIIEKEIEKLLKSTTKEMHDRIFTFGYNQKYFKSKKSKLFEIFARRNAIVHSNSKADSQYMKASGNIYKFKSNDIIKTDLEYLKESVLTLLTIGLIIVSGEWNNYKFDYTEEESNELNNTIERIAFKTLLQEKWESCFHIYEVIKEIPKLLIYQESFTLNYMLSGKKINDDKALNDIRNYNYSSREIIYRIGYFGMLCDYDKVKKLIESVEETPINSISLIEWPIFLDLRSENEKKFNEILELCKESELKETKELQLAK